jgi:Protein of unknown function (DUF3631)
VAAATEPLTLETAGVLADVANLVKRYIVMTDEQAAAEAMWAAHCWTVEAADQTPYLHVRSHVRRSGKTTNLELLEEITPNSLRTINASTSAIYRFIEMAGTPTMLLDEMDAIWQGRDEYAEALRGILNAGNRRGAGVLRCENFTTVKRYSVFGPKALSGIGDLPDTISDRSIPIVLKRRLPSEHVERFRVREYTATAAPVKARLEAWAPTAIDVLRDARPELPEVLNDRQQDVCEPLLAIADLAGPAWSEYARTALVSLLDGGGAAEESWSWRCLRDCREVLTAPGVGEAMMSEDLVRLLRALPDGSWATAGAGANGLTTHWLGRLLNEYDIHSIRTRFHVVPGQPPAVRHGYAVAHFRDAWERYVVPVEGDVVPVEDGG